MQHIDFYLDFISPYAHLAFEELPRALEGLGYDVAYRPILFAGLLKHHGQLGPAEIAPKRDWTYRHVRWQADALGVRLDLPAAHPFNPLALLRLAWAAARPGSTPNRFVCETVLRHVWHGGAAADDAARLAQLTEALAPARDAGSDAVKQQLKDATQAALAAGVFGVPSFVADGRVFWGLDALPMLRAQLEGDARIDQAWAAAASVAQGVRR
ncbi:MAG: DsbA family protein [Pseudomonadota bacterium]|nr:DsbA family protein [Pseudomonadota bacterium]